jgi:hypothetical protein
MVKKVSFGRKLRFEGLERRDLLAVTVVPVGTELRITGDINANTIVVERVDVPTPGSIIVTSEDGPEGTFTGITNIKAELKGGDDFLFLRSSSATPLPGNLDVKAGLGNDTVSFDNPGPATGTGPLDVAGNVTIETSDGNDDVIIPGGTAIGGNLTVNTGHDRDDLAVAGEFANKITVGGNVLLKTGEGDDGDVAGVTGPTGGVNIGDILVTGTTVIETSDGADVVNVGGQSTFGGGLKINSGLGDDRVRVGNDTEALTIGGLLDLNTSEGDDRLHVELNNTGPGPATVIRTSDGADVVNVRDSFFASLDVNTGLGDDSLSFLAAVVVAGNATLNGSGGTNDVLFDDGLTAGSRSDSGFETTL